MKIALAADHAGFQLKQALAGTITGLGAEVIDLGVHAPTPPADYPDSAEVVGEAVRSGRAARGIIVCGSGVGVCIAANKIPGIRAGVCHDTYSARQGVEHDDMNVLCLGERIVGLELAREIVRAFLGARFAATEERHVRRLEKVRAIERRNLRTD